MYIIPNKILKYNRIYTTAFLSYYTIRCYNTNISNLLNLKPPFQNNYYFTPSNKNTSIDDYTLNVSTIIYNYIQTTGENKKPN